MQAVCVDFGAELREFNGEQDHVHLLVHYPPSVGVSKLVNSLKGVSARYLRQEHGAHLHRYLWGGHLWSPSYFAGSGCGAPLTVVKEYIETRNVPPGDGFPPALPGVPALLTAEPPGPAAATPVPQWACVHGGKCRNIEVLPFWTLTPSEQSC